MAVLGSQIVITMVFASLLSKVGSYFSLGRWLLTSSRLIRYMYPSDEELRKLANVPLNTSKKNNTNKKGSKKNHQELNNHGYDTFTFLRTTEIQLETAPVTELDAVQLRFYEEYLWLVDFALYTLFVYIATEFYIYFLPERAALEVNLSMVWCLLLGGFAYKILCSLSGLYFQGEDTGERSLVIVMGFAYLFLAMLVLVVQEETLETGLDDAYASFNKSAAIFLADNSGLDSSGPASKLVLKFFLALWCGSIGALFTFPGIRLSKMHWDVLQHSGGDNPGIVSVLLHLSFISPLLLSTMWIKPLSREYLTQRTFKGMEQPFMSCEQFETFRLLLVFITIFLRVCLMSRYLQSYLNVAYYRIESLRQEAGRISNVDFQKIVARVFYYLCVVTLQFLAPMMLVLSLTLMYKTMGGGSWDGLWAVVGAEQEECANDQCSVLPQQQQSDVPFSNNNTDEDSKTQFSLAWQSLKQVFTASVFRGLLGFSLWWCCLVWFISSALGLTYQTYFAKV